MSSQIKNLKPRTTKKKIKHLGVLFFSLFLTLAVFSQVAAKPTSDVGFGRADWLYYKSSNDITAYLGKKSSNLPTVRYQKNKDYLEFSMTGVSSSTSVSLETDVKTPNTPTLFYRNILKNVDANYQITNIPFKIKEEIILKKVLGVSDLGFREENGKLQPNTYNLKPSPQNLKPITFLFSAETSAKPVKQDDGSIAFFDNQNNYLFQLDKPFMTDAKSARSEAVSIEIVPTNKKPIVSNGFFDAFTGASAGIVNRADSLADRNILSSSLANIKKVLEARGIEPPRRGLTIPTLRQAAPRTGLVYHKPKPNPHNLTPKNYTLTLSADSDWLNDPNTVYPVIIDPTVTHNADANFTGQMNRIADNDSTSSTQLESSYPEATKDPYTVLLLHFNEANGTTAGIRDYASTTRVITANGNASTTNYVTQLGMGNSAAFDGTSDYFEISDSDDWDFAASSTDTTISMWVYANDILYTRLIGQSNAGADGNWSLGISQSDNNGDIYLGTAGGPVLSSGNGAIIAGRWYNIAIAKRNGFTEMYKDGLLVASGSAAYFNAATTFLRIGARAAADGDFNGYIDNIRILKGRALTPEEIKAAASRRPYAVYTSPVVDASASVQWDTLNWTEGGVATGNGEQPYNTNSLVAQWDFNDTSGTTLTASSSGSCTTACNGTLTNFAYTASQDQATTTTGWTANNKKWGAGGLMFDGVNDYVSVNDGAVTLSGFTAFTATMWVNQSSIVGGDVSALLSNDQSGNSPYILYVNTSRQPYWYLNTANGTFNVTSPISIDFGKWNFLTYVYNGSTMSVYVNGVFATSTPATGTMDTAANAAMRIGMRSDGALPFNGIIDSTVLYSRALSASEILSNYNAGNIEIQTRTGATSDPNDGTWEAWKPTTGETQLLSMDSDQLNWNYQNQSDAYTKLLLHMDGTDASTIFVNSATTTHTATGTNQAQIDTAQSKFGGSSALFDGTGDYLSVPDSDDWSFGSGDFTIDTWIRFNALPGLNSYSMIYSHFQNSSNYIWFTLMDDAGTKNWQFYAISSGVATHNVMKAATVTTGIWYHVVITRTGNDFKIFQDGTQVGTTVTDSDAISNVPGSLYIGIFDGSSYSFNGWLDELRISKGIARWTSNFTPPTGQYRPYYPRTPVQLSDEGTIKMEGASSTKFMIGAPQVDGNTVALWHLEETGTTTGTYLYDETANNNDATTTGTTVVDGIFGKGRSFNGVTDNADIAYNTSQNLTTAFTLEAWIKPEDNTATALVFAKGVWDTGPYNFGLAATGGLLYQVRASSVTTERSVALNSISIGQWYHIALTYDKSNIKAYINGELKDTYAYTSTLDTDTNNLKMGSHGGLNRSFKGIVDEPKVSNRALSADEIAETYRMGANHHLTRQVSAVDLSSANKLAFNVAADRPGTYLETMLGESDYANYELASSTLALSTTTVLYIKGDEIASSTSIKDSSFSGKAITANGNARTAGGGKIGNSVYFDGTGDYLSLADSNDWNFGSGDFTVDTWVRFNATPRTVIAAQWGQAPNYGWSFYYNSNTLNFDYSTTGSNVVSALSAAWTPSLNTWYHFSVVRNVNTIYIFVNGVQIGSQSFSATVYDATVNLTIAGQLQEAIYYELNGWLDELRISKGIALTPDQIRQAYEYGLRSHQITIDFGATLQTSDLISNATDYNFSIMATTSGLSATTSGLYLGDKIIIKENLGGTEYTAQGTVNAINTATGAITVPSWDTGSTFPASNGYSPNATVFKWQREYFDLTGAATTTRNAITNLTLRPTNGAEGRTIYLDDFRYNTNYLTASSSSAITSSNGRYLQYRAIFTSWDSFVSPYLSAINTLYTSTANMFAPLIGVSGGGFLSF